MLLEAEVTAAAALDPLRRCRDFAMEAVVKEHRASKLGGGVPGRAWQPLLTTSQDASPLGQQELTCLSTTWRALGLAYTLAMSQDAISVKKRGSKSVE